MNFGERLREERERLGMSQTDFADVGGVGRKSQFNYESGDRSPDLDYLAAIAEAGADVRYIVTGKREGPPPLTLSANELELLALFRAAPLAVKAAAIGALQSGAGATASKLSVGGKVQGQVVEGSLINHGPVNIGNKTRGRK